jgi:predicted PurR-regulated permease PerM
MKDPVNKSLVLILTIAISILFFTMIKGMLLTLLFAALFAALIRPMYVRLKNRFRGKKALASLTTLTVWLLLIFIPFIALISILVNQAVKAAESYGPWVEENLGDTEHVVAWLEKIPLIHVMYPEQDELIATLDKLVDSISEIFVSGLSDITGGTATFFFLTFVLLYSMFFFLIYGDKLLYKILYYFPLTDEQESRLLEKFTKVTRATLKGTFIIGVVQGTVAALAMWVAGIPYTIFWGAIMAVLSIIPAIGPGLIWLPAGIVLIASGQTGAGVGLILFCAIVVGSIDNVLRPIMVGRDTEMPDLMIFLSTLGGISMFGISGVVIGPLIAAVFLTIWDIYGTTFKDILPKVDMKLDES